ncbi:hypothetical protein O181_032394 [Austropuccinia psidii MF-1]|uniref:Uncharacterized protein n=1 Tax=Austropuccinia psidii MF-1 TaxID=1389203 RepID=A0A9Q3CXC7_9BASI|nr:hypothetical protein [Austropuccinia psidii MF-1]
MPRGYSKKLHPDLYQTNIPSDSIDNNIKTKQQEPTMSTTKPAPNPAESETNVNHRLSRVWTTISQARALIKSEHILKLDGRNFKSWKNRISIILDNFIDDTNFLHREGLTLSSDEKICGGILIYSLPETIQSELLGLKELLNARMQSEEAPSSYALRLQLSASKLIQQGGTFSEDLLLGLLLQRGIQDQEMARTVMLQLENEVANKGRNPNLTTCHQILKSAYQ